MPIRKDKLYAIYGLHKDTKEYVFVENIRAINEQEVITMVTEKILDTPKHKRKYVLWYWRLANKINKKSNKKIDNKELIRTPLEVNRNQRLEVFGPDIIKGYKHGISMVNLHKKYHVSFKKIRQFLIDSGVKKD